MRDPGLLRMLLRTQMMLLKYILVFPVLLVLPALKPGDGPTKNCKLSSSYSKKDSTTTFRSKGIDWAELEKKVGRKDSSIYMTIYITDGEMDNSDGIRFIFRDGTSLTKPDATAKHEMGLAAAGGSTIHHSSTFYLSADDIKKLKEELVLEYRIGKAAARILSEKQALKFRDGLDCIINAR
jgi:hypothetical protein